VAERRARRKAQAAKDEGSKR